MALQASALEADYHCSLQSEAGEGDSLSWGLLSPLHSFRELWAIFLSRPLDNSLANSAIPGLSHFLAHHPIHITEGR